MILRVLVASRHSDLLQDTECMVPENGMIPTLAPGPEAMWDLLRSKPFDLLVVDRAFLGSRPAADFEELRGLAGAPESIVLLAEYDPRLRAELLDAGALACLAGDIDRQTLYRTIGALVRLARRLAEQNLGTSSGASEGRLSDFASRSPAMQGLLATARKVVDSQSSLLVMGETGVGKEFLARAIHREGPRGKSPFVAVNCGALPEGLVESELFGHVAGAFTGAQRPHRGFFELAHGGTLFLDEVAELPLQQQVKLLRVLQERTVRPVGSERVIPVDVRLVAATNRDLMAEVEAGRFRSDLYYRLGVVPLTLPPLRDRREDIPDLLTSQVEHFARALGRAVSGVTPPALDLLAHYSWPGNVRELINVVERAILLTEGDAIGVSDLPEEVRALDARAGAILVPGSTPLREAREEVVDAFERRYLVQLLEETRGRIGVAAARAEITPRALFEKLKRLGIRKETFRLPSHRESSA